MKRVSALTLAGFVLPVAMGLNMAFAQSVCAQAFGSTTTSEEAEFGQVDGSKNVSQLIRSNAAHYWNYVASSKEDSGLRAYAGFKGVVAGDPHVGNFSVLPLAGKDGVRVMREVNIDFDDAGIGSFAYDFARFVVTVKAIDKDVKILALLEAYIEGLQGREVAAPKIVTEALAMPIAMYDRLEHEYVDRKTKKGSFKLKEGELEAYSGSLSRSEIAALFPNEKVLDLATRPKERGGSAEAERIWVYTERPDGVQKIYELKGYMPTSMEKYASQAPALQLAPVVRSVFWAGVQDDNYRLIEAGSKKKLFWLRDKKVALFDIPYNMKNPANKQLLADYSLYVASKLGQAHGSQASGQKLLAEIQKNPDQFREAVKSLNKTYLQLALDTLGK